MLSFIVRVNPYPAFTPIRTAISRSDFSSIMPKIPVISVGSLILMTELIACSKDRFKL